MKGIIWIYLVLFVVFGAGIFAIIDRGQRLPAATQENSPAASAAALPVPAPSPPPPLLERLREPISRLCIQVIVIVLATRLVGALFTQLGQPSVVGEVVAGILLGPSLLGWLWPQAQSFVFPRESLGALSLLSQLGVCLFMFVVGLELEVGQLRKRAQTAVLVSHVSIFLPFSLGVALALFLYSRYAVAGTSFTSFALFMGIAVSITAFPVLARILKDRGVDKTFLGTTAIACAAVDDATAWIILAFVIAIAHATSLSSTALGVGMVLIYLGLMLFVVRPALPRLLDSGEEQDGRPSRGAIAAVLLIIIASVLATELIGVHALFGAFVAGVVMPPRKVFREHLAVRLESFSSLFLLPLFFAFNGLRTSVTLLNSPSAWLTCLAIIGVATLGKLGGTMLAARLTGMGWNDSFALGALMNTRGLVELVALNIGYDLGILPPRIFTMMVLMALVTTLLTGPLLNLSGCVRRRAVAEAALA